jgi:hypothetical protein
MRTSLKGLFGVLTLSALGFAAVDYQAGGVQEQNGDYGHTKIQYSGLSGNTLTITGPNGGAIYTHKQRFFAGDLAAHQQQAREFHKTGTVPFNGTEYRGLLSYDCQNNETGRAANVDVRSMIAFQNGVLLETVALKPTELRKGIATARSFCRLPPSPTS